MSNLVCEDCGEILVYEGILMANGRILREKGEILQAVCEICFGEAEDHDD